MNINRRKNLSTLLSLVIVSLFVVGAADAKEKKPAKKADAVEKDSDKATDGEETTAEDETESKTEKKPAADADEGRRTALVSRLVLKVVNPEDARVLLKDRATKDGGFAVLVTDSSIELKIPPEKLSDFLAFAAENGIVIEKSLERQDLTQEIAQLEGQLKSKRTILTRLRGFFDDSNVQATLRIEQTMTSLVTEIENVKGRLRVLNERATWAMVDVSFQFKQRDRIIYINSPFEWLNSVNLDRFLGDF